ncbi:PspA/IM30 family protein [Acanthopleuribacter pedis]|uniref:PspA/IM30 family protein n=1 Tax=Acanthopleuribacter pedis TaxID=442870 RepID=A0A8J7QI80_9BACT|nr:PspA/IM30 family protein [Acanthopleuribacter pedis]MBO1318805.1 PspA/IM30 family protein [Acanthopleuribacter pedis]
MGVFSRIGEIINANINAMLDKAEDPNKMVRLMINEMEDTLTRVKSSAAEVIADRIRLSRERDELRMRAEDWENKATLAVTKGRDDLAREALEQKLTYDQRAAEAGKKVTEMEDVVRKYQLDIERLEAQLNSAFQRQRELQAKNKQARNRKQVDSYLNTQDAFNKFEQFNRRLDRLEAETEVMGYGQNEEQSLEQKFAELEQSSRIEAELQKLKNLKINIKPTEQKD